MNPHLIERLAHERLADHLRRAEADHRLRAAGHAFSRLPFPDLRRVAAHFLGTRASATPTPCCA